MTAEAIKLHQARLTGDALVALAPTAWCAHWQRSVDCAVQEPL